ncbi:hypothetical protein FQN54_003286 [Arachnomyces sp. PD_36]|nr:hypothetical protein FQN54_003286 [Arachnomyces sp. PD_36]
MRANYDGLKTGYCDQVPETLPTDGKAVHLHGHTVTSFNEEGDGIRVYFEKGDGTKCSLFADLLVGADGAGSAIRRILEPRVKRSYVGCVGFRGTLLETEATDPAKAAFVGKPALFHAPNIQILAYTMPGADGSVKPGERLLNWVYHVNAPESELDELMTDVDGVRHNVTILPGKLNPKLWEKQLSQMSTDVISPDHEFLNEKVVLIGDALTGFRAHTAASTSQAAFDAMILKDKVEGKVPREKWKFDTMGFARMVQQRGIDMTDAVITKLCQSRNTLKTELEHQSRGGRGLARMGRCRPSRAGFRIDACCWVLSTEPPSMFKLFSVPLFIASY